MVTSNGRWSDEVGAPANTFSGAITELGRQRLAAGVTIYIEANWTSENSCGPGWVSRSLDAEFIDTVDAAAGACFSNGWNLVELMPGPTSWEDHDTDTGMMVNSWYLKVDAVSLWFTGSPEEEGDAVYTVDVPLGKLAAALNAGDEAGNESMPDWFRWCGGAIFYACDVDALCDLVRETVPEVNAKEMEVEMRRQIAANPATASSKPSAPATRRRMGV